MITNVSFDSLEFFRVDFGEIQSVGTGGTQYEGSYDAIPSLEEQTLNTKQKFLSKDVKIQAIPVQKIPSDTGGIAVYIASKIGDD